MARLSRRSLLGAAGAGIGALVAGSLAAYCSSLR